jgi:enolase
MPVVIAALKGREILDSRGRPTVEVDLDLSDGSRGRASVPSGESKGRHEAVELRDGDPARFAGLGVRRAVENVEQLVAPALVGMELSRLEAVDSVLLELDGTADKSRLGANCILAVSLAFARAAAASNGLPLWRYLGCDAAPLLPLPMVNMISGGLHARGGLAIQDFLVLPLSASSFAEALETSVGVHAALGRVLGERGSSTLRADEGGYGPALGSVTEALELLELAVTRAGHEPGTDVAFGLDVAATHFYDAASGSYRLDDGRTVDAGGLVELLVGWVREFPIVSIEDGLAEDDWDGWRTLTAELGAEVQLVGDDLFTTSLARLERGIELGAANAVLVKMNQIGTLSETIAVVEGARAAGYRSIVSARSGETEDAALADLAVATRAGQIKIGSTTQSERLAKYNELLRIEEELGSGADYAGRFALVPERDRDLQR